jgi:hypothetical protein
MDRLSKKIDNALKFENDKEGVILSELESINDILGDDEIAKEETVKGIDIKVTEIFKGISLIKGDKGDTPVVGKDFKQPSNGKDGYTPRKGIDYFDGLPGKDADEEVIVDKMLAQISLPKDGYTPRKGIDYLTTTELELIKVEATPVKGEDYFTEEEIKKIKKEITPKKGKDYFTKKEIEELKKKITPIKNKDYFDGMDLRDAPYGGGAGSQGSDDLTPQCNGVLKTFVIKESYRLGTMKLHSSQAPLIYRPIVDFTESADKQVTLTSEVGAPQTGQTLMAFYEKL